MSAAAGWAQSPQRLPACGVDHRSGAGRLDETARRVDHRELAVARQLVAEGHDVVTLAERGRRGSVPDFLVCGAPLEVKALLTTAERADGGRATAATVHNSLMSATRQAAVVVVSTEGSGCKPADAAAGLRSFAATEKTGKVTSVRVLGDGFDLSWLGPPRREAGVAAHPSTPSPASTPAPASRRAAPVARSPAGARAAARGPRRAEQGARLR